MFLLCLPLCAAEQWLFLIDHQIKVAKHNLKILLQQHVLITQHFSRIESIKSIESQAKKDYGMDSMLKSFDMDSM